MKTLFLSILALAGTAMAAETTFTTTNSVGSAKNNWWCNGIYVNLDPTLTDSRVSTTSSDASVSFADASQVTLDSVTLITRTMYLVPNYAAGGNASSISLALTDVSGTVLALSDNSATTAGTFTWIFSDTVVSTTDTLYLVFVNDDTTNDVQVGYTLTTDDMAAPGLGTGGVHDGGGNMDSLGFLGSNTAKGMDKYTSTNSGTYAPTVTIQTHIIPEPTTATLSLLALAGLAARRRRK